MKVGDLVTLSAYGKKVLRTGWIQNDDVGIIVRIKQTYWSSFDVMWTKSRFDRHWRHERYLDRRDLKYVK
tara:strand:- start:126 stop:335 length:210 start_codon:yes stop_codon:yes gene_type:complete